MTVFWESILELLSASLPHICQKLDTGLDERMACKYSHATLPK